MQFSLNVFWSLVAQIVYGACQWGALIAIARMGSSELLGQYALVLAVTTPVFAFATLNTRSVQASDVADQFAFGDYLRLRHVTTAAALAIVVAGGVLSRMSLLPLLVAVALAKAFDALTDCYYAGWQRAERMDVIALGMIVNNGLTLVLVAGAMALGLPIVWAGVGSAAASAASYLLVRRMRANDPALFATGPLRAGALLRLAWLALPLAIFGALGALQPNIPRYFIQVEWGSRALGTFAGLAYLWAIADTIGAAMLQPALPRLATSYLRDRAAFRRWVYSLVAIVSIAGFAAVAMTIVLGQRIIAFIYGPEFDPRLDVLVLIAIGATVGLVGGIFRTAAIASRHLREQMLVALVGVTVGAAGAALLIPGWGIAGAALSLVVAAACRLIVLVRIFSRSLALASGAPIEPRAVVSGEVI
jgi:O-antigen/teichoic acid export membrane protein